MWEGCSWRWLEKSAVARVIKEGKVRTYDMGGKDSTIDVAREVAKYAA